MKSARRDAAKELNSKKNVKKFDEGGNRLYYTTIIVVNTI
jgi:hypothetical protein